MKRIPLTQNKIALVDDSDYARVGTGWYAFKARSNFYACRMTPRPNRKIEYLHRIVMGLGPGGALKVDHRNGDGLDCRRKNLRLATNAQNLQARQRKQKGTSSRFRGVSWNKRASAWEAYVGFNKTKNKLGLFDCEMDAAKARDAAALKLHGRFAALNFA